MCSLGKLAFLLLIALPVAAAAADTPSKGITRDDVSKYSLVRDFAATFHVLPARRITLRLDASNDVCYYIHSFYRKRVDGSGVTVAAGESTCTPSSRLRMKKTQRVRILPAIER